MRRLVFFLPNLRCPHRCIYCDQGSITGTENIPTPDDVRKAVRIHEDPVELCYFGGSFTCFPLEVMVAYLECIRDAPQGSKIRFSTHPLGISPMVTRVLKDYPISVAELGIASLDDDVLNVCNRGYDRSLAIKTLAFLIDEGFLPGLQIMLGLPGQRKEPLLSGLREIAALKKSLSMPLRIYPCLVLQGTALAELWKRQTYTPLSVDEAVRWAGEVTFEAKRLGFNVIRIGLHETPSLARSVLAGPHHPALGEMARGYALALELAGRKPEGPWDIPAKDISMLTGHGARGLRTLGELTGLPLEIVRARVHSVLGCNPTER